MRLNHCRLTTNVSGALPGLIARSRLIYFPEMTRPGIFDWFARGESAGSAWGPYRVSSDRPVVPEVPGEQDRSVEDRDCLRVAGQRLGSLGASGTCAVRTWSPVRHSREIETCTTPASRRTATA